MEQVVAVQVQPVDQVQRRRRAVHLGHRDRPVQRRHRARGHGQQLVVQRDDLGPVGGRGVRRVAVHRVDGCLDLVRAGLAAAQALPDQRLALRDELPVPPAAVLVGQQHQAALRRGAGRAPGLRQQHQREQPGHLGLVRHQPGQQPAEPDRLGAQVGPDQLVTGAGRVSLVEDQVHHGQHRAEPARQLGFAGHPVRDPRVADLALGPDQPLRHRRLRHQERVRDLRRAQPAEQPQGQRDLRGGAQRGMAAGEDQPQPVVRHRFLLS